MARLQAGLNGVVALSPLETALADATNDGTLNGADADEMTRIILGEIVARPLPMARVIAVSPADGETRVAVTRETVLRFSVPLAAGAVIDTAALQAAFRGRKILSRVEISPDRLKATLFYLEPLPSTARVEVSLTAAGLTDLLGRPLDADGDGTAGGLFASSFQTVGITPVTGTGVSGRVFASTPAQTAAGTTVDVPLAGVTITVDGAEETLRTTTDALGNFTLTPCPAGTFFVHIDGRTSPASSWPNGSYYPFVGKKWFAQAGRTDNPAGGADDTETGPTGTIYLPCVCAGTLLPVSPTVVTPVAFPASVLAGDARLVGTGLTVPPNALFADDGTRGGRVGIAPVAPDRLPSPLPPGLSTALVITIQTDGATNFASPVGVCLPNLANPQTRRKLPPGARSALWSFNHDVGEWEVAGTMTVTADGLFVKTDPGSGVR